MQKDFHYKDISESESVNPESGEHDQLVEHFELYEKIKVAYRNVFYRQPPSPEQIRTIKEQVKVRVLEYSQEKQVELKEQKVA